MWVSIAAERVCIHITSMSQIPHTHRVAAQAMFGSAHGTSLERLHPDIELIVVVGIAIGSVDVCWREVLWLHVCPIHVAAL